MSNKDGTNLRYKDVAVNYNSGRLRIKKKYNGKLALFDVVYACKNGNGTIDSKEGSLYRGRGLTQLTWKSNYKKYYRLKYKKEPSDKELEAFAKKISEDIELSTEVSLMYWTNNGNRRNNNNYIKESNDPQSEDFEKSSEKVGGIINKGKPELEADHQDLRSKLSKQIFQKL